MNIIFVITVIILVVGLVFILVRQVSQDSSNEIGTIENIQPIVEKLLASRKVDNFVIINNVGTEDFFQMQVYEEGAQIDFPIVTERQKFLESKIRKAVVDRNRTIAENPGSDGSNFIDVDVEKDVQVITQLSIYFLKSIFNASDSTKLEFQLNI